MIALLSQWRLFGALGLAAAAALAVGWALVERVGKGHLAAELAARSLQLYRTVEANASLEASLAALRADHGRQLAALAADRDRALRQARRVQQTREEIRNAPTDHDGPVAPVLSGLLDRLRRADSAPDRGAPGGAPEPAARSADLPGQP